MALAYAESLRHTRLDAIDNAVNAGTGGFLRIYGGTRPATGGAATTLLAELAFNATAFGAATGGTLTAAAITEETAAIATGTAEWFRVVASAGTFVMDGSVAASGSDLNLNTVSIVLNGEVQVTSFVITAGNA